MVFAVLTIVLYVASLFPVGNACVSDIQCNSLSEPFCCQNWKCCSSPHTIFNNDDDVRHVVGTGANIAVGVIVAIVVGIVILIIACIVGCVICCRKSQNRGYVARAPMGATTVHTTTNVMQPHHGYHPGQVNPNTPAYVPPGQPMPHGQPMSYPPAQGQPMGGPPPYLQTGYPPQVSSGYPTIPQPPHNPHAGPHITNNDALPPAYGAHSDYPTKESVQASAPPMP